MINSVRNTVMAILNKNNYGYLSPSDFNLFAQHAQLEIFTSLIAEYNEVIKKQNQRSSGSGYADERASVEHSLEEFMEIKNLVPDSDNVFFMPSATTTGSSAFKIDKVLCYRTVGAETVLLGEAEKVPQNRITLLSKSLLTGPSEMYPAYTISLDKMTIFPDTIDSSDCTVECYYIRYPKDPKWTYISIGNGSPVFDQSQSDYQDFELGREYENKLIVKILSMAGIEIRESMVYQYAKVEENKELINKQ